jgi:protocatechuate 3,4-dioxygenase beta subunit
VEFQQLPGGQWIVPRWYIRMPRVAQMTSTDSLLGYQEVGGTSRPAGTAAPVSVTNAVIPAIEDKPAAGPQSFISGVVYDSTTGTPLQGVHVSTGGGRFKTTTSTGGHYELAIDGPLSDTIVFEHPRLRLYRVATRMQSISLPSGSRGQANVLVPSYGTLRRSLCGQNETATDSQGIAAGYVRDAAGNPVPNAHVWATWQILWVEQNGRLVSTNQQRTVETDTGSDGSYLMCGFTRGAQITAKVGMAGRNTMQEKLVLPANMVLEHDFRLAAR